MDTSSLPCSITRKIRPMIFSATSVFTNYCGVMATYLLLEDLAHPFSQRLLCGTGPALHGLLC